MRPTLLAGVAAVVAMAVAARRGWLVVSVAGPSMEPALGHGARLLVRRHRGERLDVGDIVVFTARPADHDRLLKVAEVGVTTSNLLVKRVAAREGDPIPQSCQPTLGTGRVPAGSVVVLGDNLDVSWDSRHCGFVDSREVVGRVVHAG